MTRALLLPLAAILALATGVGLLGVAATVSMDPIVLPPTTAIPDTTETPADAGTPMAGPLIAEGSVVLPAGSATLRLVRFILRSGTGLPPQPASGPMLLVVEKGAVSVRSEGAAWIGHGLDAVQIETMLRPGERFVVTPGVYHAIRNDGPTSAVVFAVAIEPASFGPDERVTVPLRAERA